jgi:tRNA-2-methylthio-N6-dimethylallyladenosine synthase
VITTLVTGAAPHYLLADGAPVSVRRTRGGDAFQARGEAQRSGTPSGAVLLGMPTTFTTLADSRDEAHTH